MVHSVHKKRESCTLQNGCCSFDGKKSPQICTTNLETQPGPTSKIGFTIYSSLSPMCTHSWRRIRVRSYVVRGHRKQRDQAEFKILRSDWYIQMLCTNQSAECLKFGFLCPRNTVHMTLQKSPVLPPKPCHICTFPALCEMPMPSTLTKSISQPHDRD